MSEAPMPKILVIADDFTGAAEIAAAGTRYGLTAAISCGASTVSFSADLIAIDTDTRHLSPDRTVVVVTRMLQTISAADFDFVYKKTDSVLRGPVAAELNAVANRFRKVAVLFLPQNPSRKRTIIGGIYRIDGVPLDQTVFATDPTHPAKTADVCELLGDTSDVPIMIADASTAVDIRQRADGLSSDMLAAGGIDFFEANLRRLGLSSTTVDSPSMNGNIFIVCGSTTDRSRQFIEECESQLVVHRGGDVRFVNGLAVLGSPREVQSSAAAVAGEIAVAVAKTLRQEHVDLLLVEGGATAAAICREMQWTSFDVVREWQPGVAQLRPRSSVSPNVVVKPGSYAWPVEVHQLVATRAKVRKNSEVSCAG